MLGFENNIVMAKVINENINNKMNDEFSLGKLEENTETTQKSKSGFKGVVAALVIVACVGFCFTNPSQKANNTVGPESYSMQV